MELAFWQATKFEDYAAEYDFYQPDDQKLISKDDYVKKQKADKPLYTIIDVKIEDVRIENDIATVRVTVNANTGSWPGTRNYKLIDGKWYRVMDESVKSFLGINSESPTPSE